MVQKWGISFSGTGVTNGCEPPYGSTVRALNC